MKWIGLIFTGIVLGVGVYYYQGLGKQEEVAVEEVDNRSGFENKPIEELPTPIVTLSSTASAMPATAQVTPAIASTIPTIGQAGAVTGVHPEPSSQIYSEDVYLRAEKASLGGGFYSIKYYIESEVSKELTSAELEVAFNPIAWEVVLVEKGDAFNTVHHQVKDRKVMVIGGVGIEDGIKWGRSKKLLIEIKLRRKSNISGEDKLTLNKTKTVVYSKKQMILNVEKTDWVTVFEDYD